MPAERRPLGEERQQHEEEDHEHAGERQAQGRRDDLGVVRDRDRPERRDPDADRLEGGRRPALLGDLRATGDDLPVQDAEGIQGREDRGDHPPGQRREDVEVGVVDPAVLDDDRPALLKLVQDHSLPDQEARERDDERGDADECDDRALDAADRGADGDSEQHRQDAAHLVLAARELELGHDQGPDPREIADREVDLAQQEHEDDAVGEHAGTCGLRDQVDEVGRSEEVRRREAEHDDDGDLADDERHRAEVAGAHVELRAFPGASEPGRELLLLERRSSVGADDVGRGHSPAPAAAADGTPETFVGMPAVIASTTACCVVWRRSNTPTLRPSRSTVIRSAVSKTSWRLWEMSITPRPWLPRRRTSSSTCSVCATPRAAVGSSRMTSFEFHITARATATDWRCSPESVATVWRIDLIVVTARDLSVSAVCCSIGASDRICPRLISRPRYMFWTTSRLSQSARSW